MTMTTTKIQNSIAIVWNVLNLEQIKKKKWQIFFLYNHFHFVSPGLLKMNNVFFSFSFKKISFSWWIGHISLVFYVELSTLCWGKKYSMIILFFMSKFVWFSLIFFCFSFCSLGYVSVCSSSDLLIDSIDFILFHNDFVYHFLFFFNFNQNRHVDWLHLNKKKE